MNIREMLERRANLVNQARGILETAEAEERSMTAEEREQWDRLMDQAQDLTEDIERVQRQEAAEAQQRQALQTATRPDPEDDGRALNLEFASRGLREAYEADERCFEQPLWRDLFPYASDEYRSMFRAYVAGREVPQATMRALQVDVDTAGGYLVTPIQFVDRLIQAVDNLVYMRQWGTVFSVPNADSLGAPSLDTDPADPAWTHELAIGTEDSSMAVGRRELKPHPLAKYIKISRTLLRKVPSAEALVRERLAYKFAVTEENAFLNGDGSGEPLGIFTASDYGISTSRDVSTGNTATELRFDGLIEAKYTLKPQYWPRARWMFHRDGVKQVAKLKDGESQYIWRESVRAGEPDRILGLPVFMSEYAPNTFTTGLYVGMLGDFSHYWIADSLAMEMQRLVELYAATNQIALIGRLESDGMPVLEEAFVRVKLG